MPNWLSVLQEFQTTEAAPTVSDGVVPTLEPKPKAVLFDVYGTLLCTGLGDLDEQARLASSEDSFVATANRFGFSPDIGVKWHKWFFEAISAEHKELRAKGISPAEVQVDRIWANLITRVGGNPAVSQPRMVAAYREMVANPVRAFSGAAKALRELDKGGIKLGIVSNSQFYTMPILEVVLGIDLEELFHPELTFLSFRLGYAKPSPYFFRVVRTALLHLGLNPEEALVLGNDFDNDIMAAQAHGLQALLFHGNDQSVRWGTAAQGDAVITSYEALLAAFGL